MSFAWWGWIRQVVAAEAPFLSTIVRRLWAAFEHSPIGLLFLQVPLLPIILLGAPRVAAVDVSGFASLGAFAMTAATLWLTVRHEFWTLDA